MRGIKCEIVLTKVFFFQNKACLCIEIHVQNLEEFQGCAQYERWDGKRTLVREGRNTLDWLYPAEKV